LQTVTDLGQFSRREVNALLLDFRALLPAVSAHLLAVSELAKRPTVRAKLRASLSVAESCGASE